MCYRFTNGHQGGRPRLSCFAACEGKQRTWQAFGLIAHGDLPHSGTRTRVFRALPRLVFPLTYVRMKTHVQELNLCTALSSACACAAQLLALQPRAAVAPTCAIRLTSDYHTAISHRMRTITLLTDPAHAAVFHAHCHSLWGTVTPTSAGSEPATGPSRGI